MAQPTIKLKHDKQLHIATAGSRKAVKWVNSEVLWSEFLARLSVPIRTQETMAEYQSMSKPKRDNIKDVGGFVGGYLMDGRRRADSVESRSLITLDLDSIPVGTDIWSMIDMLFDCAAVLYSTHSSTVQAERVRIVIPLAREVSPDEYGAIARRVASDIGMEYCDDTTYEPSRLMYWASCPLDADYIFHYQDAPFLDPDEVLATYKDWHDVTLWPVAPGRDRLVDTTQKRQKDPREKHGVIAAFCKVYDIPSAIETFIPGTYTKLDENRWTYAEGSTTGGLVLYEGGTFAYSHHGTDPISGKLVNSFDLVRLHKFRDLDADEAEDTVVTKLPSYKAMLELAMQDEDVTYQLALDNVSEAFSEATEGPEKIDTDWLKKLELTNKGAIASTIDNGVLILLNDVRLQGNYFYDAFRERPIVSGDLPWVRFCDRVSEVWGDTDDAGLRRFFELEYKIESANKIRDAIDLAMLKNIRHPVREYLDGLTWDGEERLDRLFIDYLGAEDTAYTRAVTRAALVGAVARIKRPGCKHDHMLVLVGPQGCGKSTTLAKLGRKWFSDSLFTMSGKEAYEQVQGKWIIELSEMAAARKSETEQIKSFVSKQVDSYRSAYARRTQDHPRQCVFFGSTNDDEFLRDLTGARRFWPVTVDETGLEKMSELTDEVIDQIWAEAVEAYSNGEKWYLQDREIIKEARRIQEEHTEDTGKKGQILDFVARKIPKDWDEMSLSDRRLFWGGSFGETDESSLVERDKICALEVWCELYNGGPRDLKQMDAREINKILSGMGWKKSVQRFGADYGRQRCFLRK